MYCEHYGFSAKPFQLSPDARFFYGSKNHSRAMAYLEYGVHQGEGFVVITGEIGAGKTTLVANLFRKLQADKIVAAKIVNSNLDADDTLRMVVSAFGLPYADGSKSVLLKRLELYLRQVQQQGKRALLVVDETQNMAASTLEELRMLSNFQSTDKSLLQIFLLGQPEFRRTLMSGEMQQLRQRVIAAFHLGCMEESETHNYIDHRLRTVGWQGRPGFNDDAYVVIHAYSGGIPRRINMLCDRLLLMGFLENLSSFDGENVREVIRDIEQDFSFSMPEPEEGAGLDGSPVIPLAPPHGSSDWNGLRMPSWRSQ